MLTDPTDTLAYHQSRVLCQHRDMSHASCEQVAKAVNKFGVAKDTKPEVEALWFYGLNHAVALISAKRAPLEPLTDQELKIVNAYYDGMQPKAVRAFYYLLICCIREARHNMSKSSAHPKMIPLFGLAAANFFCKGTGSEQDIHMRFINNPPLATIGQVTAALQWQFYNCSWSGGYGGPAWGAIADCLHRFVTGEYTAEMMLDTVWTLSHNNGTVFNKPHHYINADKMRLIKILDVQRSGQIPEMILSDVSIAPLVGGDLLDLMQTTKAMFHDKIGDYVDWYVVEALGSVGKYPTECKAQIAKYGVSAKATEAQKAAAKAEAAKVLKEKMAEEHYEKTHFKVMPDLVVKKFEMVRAA